MRYPRDSQRSKVYAAEGEWRTDAAMRGVITHFATYEECQAYVAKVWRRKRVHARKYYASKPVPRVCGGARNMRAWSHGGRITLSPGSRRVCTLLHETAHEMLPRDAGHGWHYADMMLFLVREMLGKAEHDALKACYRKHRVKFRAPRAKKVLTVEQRAVLIERMAHARAARMARMMKLEPVRQTA